MALPRQGAISHLGVVDEVTWGTEVARTAWAEVANDATVLESADGTSQSKFGLETLRDVAGIRRVTGPVSFDPHYDGILGQMLKHACGLSSVVTTNPGTLAYEHTITLQDVVTAGFTAEVNKGGQGHIFEGAMIDTLNLAINLDNILLAEMGLVAEDETLASPGTPTFPAENPIDHLQFVFKIDDVEVSLSSDANVNLANALNIDRRKHGARLINQPIFGAKKLLTGTFETEYGTDTDAIYTAFRDRTYRKLTFLWTAAADSIETDHEYEFEITVWRARLQVVTPPVGSEDVMPLIANWLAHKDATNGTVDFRLKNKLTAL